MRLYFHLFGASKGGVGKTILVYNLLRLLAYENLDDASEKEHPKRRVALLDINDNEQDAYDLMRAGRQNYSRSLFGPFFPIEKCPAISYVSPNPEYPQNIRRDNYVLDDRNSLPYRLYKLDSDDDLMADMSQTWAYILSVVLDLRYQIEKLNEDVDEIHLIVDTNKNLLRFVPDVATHERMLANIQAYIRVTQSGLTDYDDYVSNALEAQKDLGLTDEQIGSWRNPFQHVELRFWNIWTPKAILKLDDDSVVAKYSKFNTAFSGINEHIYSQFTHVFNPSAFIPPPRYQSAKDKKNISKTEPQEPPQAIQGLEELSKINQFYDSDIAIDSLTKILGDIKLSQLQAPTMNNYRDFFLKLHSVIMSGQAPYHFNGKIHKNLFFIGYYYPRLQAFIDINFLDSQLKNSVNAVYRGKHKTRDFLLVPNDLSQDIIKDVQRFWHQLFLIKKSS